MTRQSVEAFEFRITGGTMRGERHGRPGAPRLLFAHANGFCASAYRQMCARLADRYEVFALDLRGHGRTELPAEPDRHVDWTVFGRDIAALLDAAGEGPGSGRKWRVAGHSLGAVAVLLAAAGRDDVEAVRLIEPVLLPGPAQWLARTPLWRALMARTPLVKGARERRNHWPDRAAVRAGYARKPLFAAWADGVLDDYLAHGLVEAADGGVMLACAPAWEAANYLAQRHDPLAAFRRLRAPLGLQVGDRGSTTAHGVRRRLVEGGARVDVLAGAGHLIPFEAPEAAARFIAADLNAPRG